MRIQFCGNVPFERNDFLKCTYSDIEKYEDFANYDLTIINFNDKNLWKYKKYGVDSIDKMNDVKHILNSVTNENKEKILMLMPENLMFKHSHEYSREAKNIQLRDCISLISKVTRVNGILFQPTTTQIYNSELTADFHFNDKAYSKWLTKSDNSNRSTSVEHNNVCYTFLKIDSAQKMIDFIYCLFGGDKIVDAPKWIEDYNFYNDEKLKNDLKDIEDEITRLNDKKNVIQNDLVKNSKVKSALYLTSTPLENIVREILGNIFECDFSNWVDDGEHDFIVKYKDEIIIGDVKGTKNNAKRQYISQIDDQNEAYCDDNKVHPDSTIKLGIFNTFKDRSLVERDEFVDDTIKKAKKQGVIIMTTIQLLELYEKFLDDKITADDIVEHLKKSQPKGVLLQEQ